MSAADLTRANECAFVMPVYNEAGCIEQVCREWLNEAGKRNHRLIVVDDGSTDDTPTVLQRLAQQEPLLTVVRTLNGGHGSAVLRGYREALHTGSPWVFQVDSDGQFRAEDFYKLWDRRFDSDFILGVRAARKDPAYRKYLSKAHRSLLSAIFGVNTVDPNIPYRLMKASVLHELMSYLPEPVFAPNVFLAVLAARAGYDTLNIPVTHLSRAAGESTLPVRKMFRLCKRCFGEIVSFRKTEFRQFTRRGVKTQAKAAQVS